MGGLIFTSQGSVRAFDIGISGLNAARIALQVTGHNIANVSTEGYSRQYAVQTTAVPATSAIGSIGRGTEIIGIEAVRDAFLEAQIMSESGELGYLEMTDNILGQVETILNPLSSGGISDALDNLLGGFSDLASDPESLSQREELLSLAESLEKKSEETIGRLQSLTQSINDRIGATLDEINATLDAIAEVNVSIAASYSTGQSAEDYIDRRNLLVRELSTLMDIDTYTNENGALTVVAKNGSPLVVQNDAATLTTAVNSYDANKLEIVSDFNGTLDNITEHIRGGELGALLQQRDGVVADMISAQRQFNAILADVINIQHRLGTDLNGNAGGNFFEDPFQVADVSAGSDILGVTIVGDNATYEVNYDVLPSSASTVTAIDIADADLLTKLDYTINFTSGAGDYEVINEATGETVATGTLVGLTASFDGLDVTFDALPASGDSFELNFAGRTGVTGDVYRVEFSAAGDYEVLNVTNGETVTTGNLAAAGFIFFDGLAVEFDAVPADGDFFTIGYTGLQVSDTLTAETIAASDSPAGTAEPGNNGNALMMSELANSALVGLGSKTFTQYQSGLVSAIGVLKSASESALDSQQTLVENLEIERDEVSGVSLDEEAAALIEFQQAYQASARYISAITELTDYLISSLAR